MRMIRQAREAVQVTLSEFDFKQVMILVIYFSLSSGWRATGTVGHNILTRNHWTRHWRYSENTWALHIYLQEQDREQQWLGRTFYPSDTSLSVLDDAQISQSNFWTWVKFKQDAIDWKGTWNSPLQVAASNIQTILIKRDKMGVVIHALYADDLLHFTNNKVHIKTSRNSSRRVSMSKQDLSGFILEIRSLWITKNWLLFWIRQKMSKSSSIGSIWQIVFLSQHWYFSVYPC